VSYIVTELTSFKSPGEDFGILNLASITLVEHKRDRSLISDDREVSAFEEMWPTSNGFDDGDVFFLDNRVMFFARIRVRDLNATGRPPCDTIATITKSEASVSTSKGTPFWIVVKQALLNNFFSSLKVANASPLNGSLVGRSSGPAVFENLGIHLAQYENMPETRFSSLGVRGGGKSNKGCSLCGSGFTFWDDRR